MPSCCTLPVNPDNLAISLPTAFAQRLQEFYRLKQAPRDLEELIELRRQAGRIWTPSSAELLVSTTPTRHEVRLKDQRLHVHCALDALMYPLLIRKEAEIRSRCPECGNVIQATVRASELVFWTPQSAVLWLGISAEGEACCASESDLGPIKQSVCPFINLFDVPEHLERWRTQNEHVLGVQLSPPQAFALARGLCAREIIDDGA